MNYLHLKVSFCRDVRLKCKYLGHLLNFNFTIFAQWAQSSPRWAQTGSELDQRAPNWIRGPQMRSEGPQTGRKPAQACPKHILDFDKFVLPRCPGMTPMIPFGAFPLGAIYYTSQLPVLFWQVFMPESQNTPTGTK